MAIVPLPLRTGPKLGTFAFTREGEEQIYEAVKTHKMSPVQVAARVDVSVPTIYAICKRVEQRRGEANGKAPDADTRGGQATQAVA